MKRLGEEGKYWVLKSEQSLCRIVSEDHDVTASRLVFGIASNRHEQVLCEHGPCM